MILTDVTEHVKQVQLKFMDSTSLTYTGWTQDSTGSETVDQQNDQQFTLQLTPCDPLEGASTTEGQVEPPSTSTTEGQVEPASTTEGQGK